MPITVSCSFQRIGRSLAYGHHRRAVEVCKIHIAILLGSCTRKQCHICSAMIVVQQCHLSGTAGPVCPGSGILRISVCFISSFISRPVYSVFPL